MIWNIVIAGLTLLAGGSIGYGLYEVVFTRRPQINSWIVRGLVLLCIPVYVYLTYRYTGKIYLTKNLNLLIVVFIWIQLFAIVSGYLDTRSYRRNIENHPGDTTYLTSLREATIKHTNPWRDFQRVFKFIKGKAMDIGDKKGQKKNNVAIVNGKKKVKKEVVATQELTQYPKVNEQAIVQNRNLQTNSLKPRMVSTTLTPAPRRSGMLVNTPTSTPTPRRTSGPLVRASKPTTPPQQLKEEKPIQRPTKPIQRPMEPVNNQQTQQVQRNVPRIYVKENN